MDRRDFLKGTAALALTVGIAGRLGNAAAAEQQPPAEGKTPDLVALRGDSPAEMFDAGIALFGGMSAFVKPGQSVVIKPNIGWDRPPESGANTNPEMERVAGMIPVGDRSGMVKHYIRRIVRFWKVVWWFIVSSIRVHRDQKGRSGWDAVACSARHAREWARGSARIFNFEIEVHGDPQQFPGGLIVSNHQGYLDILTHAAIFPIRFAPKMEMRKWPVLGPFVAQSRPIWINRTSRQKSKEAADEMIATLEHKINLLVYPEGTSTDGEHGLLPFKSTPFEAAVEAGCRIQPLLTFFSSGDPNAYPLAWFGHAALFPHIWRILGLSHVKADVYILPVVEPVPGENRKELAARVHELMCAEYKRIKGHDET